MQFLSPAHAHERSRFVEDLLAIMTADEKVGQLVLAEDPPDPASIAAQREDGGFFDRLRNGCIGAVRGVAGAPQAEALQRIAVEESRLGIPLLIATPAAFTSALVLPPPVALAASFSPQAWALAGRMLAEEAEAVGANWVFGPRLAQARHDTLRGYLESAGESTWLATHAMIAQLRAMAAAAAPGQPPRLLTAFTLASRSTRLRRGDGALALADELGAVLDIIDAARPGSFAVEPGLDSSDDHPVAGSALAANRAIRPGGYGGILLNDWLDLALRSGQRDAPAPYPELSAQRIRAAQAAGDIDEQDIDDAVRRVLAAKFTLGLFGERLAPPRPVRSLARSPDQRRESALQLARQSVILLRNDPAILPLDAFSGEILVVGAAANDAVLPLSGAPGRAVTLVEGLEALGLRFRFVPGLALRHEARGGDRLIDADRMAIGMAAEAARRARTVVIVLGSTAEPGRLDAAQDELLKAVCNASSRVVLVTLGDRPLDPDIDGQPVPSVLHAGPLGTLSGHALAEILVGESQPTGRLPVTMRTAAGAVRLPFGHGLSYSEFALSEFTAELGPEGLAVSAVLRNTGEREGDGIVQLYVQRQDGAMPMPQPALRGLRRQFLRPGESERVGFLLGLRDLGHYDNDGHFRLEATTYVVRIGLNSERALGAEIALPESIVRMLTAGPVGDSYIALRGAR